MDNKKLDYKDITEIDLKEKFNLIHENWRVVLTITLVFFAIGLFHYVFAPDDYLSLIHI